MNLPLGSSVVAIENTASFAAGFCDVCYLHVESDVEQHRHLVRECGVRFANRVAS